MLQGQVLVVALAVIFGLKMPARLCIKKRQFLADAYAKNGHSGVKAIEKFMEEFPYHQPPPSNATPYKLYKIWKERGSVHNKEIIRKRTVRAKLSCLQRKSRKNCLQIPCFSLHILYQKIGLVIQTLIR